MTNLVMENEMEEYPMPWTVCFQSLDNTYHVMNHVEADLGVRQTQKAEM